MMAKDMAAVFNMGEVLVALDRTVSAIEMLRAAAARLGGMNLPEAQRVLRAHAVALEGATAMLRGAYHVRKRRFEASNDT